MRNCVKRKNGRKSRTNLLLLLCAYVPPYVVTCNVTYLCYIVRGSVTYVRTYLLNSFISHDKLRYVTRWPNDGGGLLLCQPVYC